MPAESTISTTDFAILASLTITPMSGYELREFIARSIGNFWSESYGQLYPALRRLESQKLVRAANKPTGARPKRVYELTTTGKRRLHAWLAEPAVRQAPRVELLLKVFFAHELPPEQLLAHFERFGAENRKVLEHYHAIAQQIQRDHGNDPRLNYWLATIRLGELHAEASLQWCAEMKAIFNPKE
jgi:PadR family transcriptional regulator AphA